MTDLRVPRRRQCYAVLAGLVLQLEAQNTGRMDLNKHIGSAVRKECPFLLFQYLCIIKLIQIILKKKKKAERFLQLSQNPSLLKFLGLVSTSILGVSGVVAKPAWRCSYLSSWLWVTVTVTHDFPAFTYVGMEPRWVSPSNLL